MIRNALAEPEAAEVDTQTALDELIQKRRAEQTDAPIEERPDFDPGTDFTTSAPNDNDPLPGRVEAQAASTSEVLRDDSGTAG